MLRNLTPAEAKFQKLTKLKLGKQLYNSGVAAVYNVGRSKLAKIGQDAYGPSTDDMIELLEYLKKVKNSSVVKLHKFGSFESFDSKSDSKIMHYYYVMDKLVPLDERNRTKYITAIYKVLTEKNKTAASGLPTKVKSFIRNASRLKYTHHDIHEYNVMETKSGVMKFIDLESFVYYY